MSTRSIASHPIAPSTADYTKATNLNASSSPKICIVGGGLSGLATAIKLQNLLPNAAITLYEAAPRVGGVIHTEKCGNFLVDHGADMFATNPPHAMKLCEELGVTERLCEPSMEGRGAKIVCNGKLVPLPEGFVLMRATQLIPMLQTPLLSVLGKLRFLFERWIPRKKKNLDAFDDESISSFVTRRMGREMLDRLVAPLTAGIYTADVSKLSMLATMAPIAKMESEYGSLAKATSARRKRGQDSVERNSAGARYSQFRAFKGGMIDLINAIVASLSEGSINLETEVKSIQPKTGGGWEISLADQVVPYDEVILATPPHITAKLLADHDSSAAELMGRIEASSAAIVILGVHRSQIKAPANCFGFVVPLNEKRQILACSFASTKFAGRAPEDQTLIRVFVGGAMQPELLEKSDEALIELTRQELSELIGLEGEPELKQVVRWNDAMPQYHVGHLERVKLLEARIEKIEGLSIVSNALHGVGISPLIGQAEDVASSIAERYSDSSNSSR